MPPDDAHLRLPDPAAPPTAVREPALFAIDPAATALPPEARPEPSFDKGPVLIGFEETGPTESEREPDRLDPARAIDEPELPTPESAREDWLFDIAAALGVHLLSFLLFMYWSAAPAEMASSIPVTLVLEEPQPPPPSAPSPPKPETKPPAPGILASVDIGDPKAPRDKAADTPEQAAEPPKEEQVATAMPPPKPMPPPELTSALPKPAPPPQPDLTLPTPEPTPAKRPEKPAAPPRPTVQPRPRPARASFGIPGPSASRDEYLAYCMSLVRQHYGVLPASFLAGRRGITVLKILVLGDGSIAGVDIAHRSGYSDIDSRVEQMIKAVHRFPPLPQWIQQPSVTLTFELAFPEGLLEQ